jgi:hypothetical protein
MTQAKTPAPSGTLGSATLPVGGEFTRDGVCAQERGDELDGLGTLTRNSDDQKAHAPPAKRVDCPIRPGGPMGKCGPAPELWELSPGAATRSLSGYRRREPEKTVLNKVVAEHLESFLRELALEGRKLPRYVEEELRRYLPCGLISEGFIRVKCRDFCPSCCARRMHDTAFHLADHVLPEAPYRHYVLSYPFPVRLALARNWGAAACARRMFLEEVFRFQRRKARRAGAVKPKTGAISFTQRFGSKLNAHLHHHAVLPDGASSTLDNGALCFVRIAAPTVEDLERILARVIRRTTRMLVSRGLLEEPDPEDTLAHLQAESLQAGLPWRLENQRSSSRLAVQLDGYSIEAGTCVHEHDRLGLLHLCRYGLRAPFSQERLRLRDDGRIELQLRRQAQGDRVHPRRPDGPRDPRETGGRRHWSSHR